MSWKITYDAGQSQSHMRRHGRYSCTPHSTPGGCQGQAQVRTPSAHFCNSHMHNSKTRQIFKSIISWFDPVNNWTENVQVYVIPIILLVCVSAKISRYLISLKINQLITWFNSKMSRRQPILTSIITTPASFLESILNSRMLYFIHT